MSCPDPLYDYDDFEDFHGEAMDYEDYNDDIEDSYADGWDDDDYYGSEVMDGDHDSAMESAGWGTDEDYGYYGEDY